jgi:hypothetical protein
MRREGQVQLSRLTVTDEAPLFDSKDPPEVFDRKRREYLWKHRALFAELAERARASRKPSAKMRA